VVLKSRLVNSGNAFRNCNSGPALVICRGLPIQDSSVDKP
jgi:hypothetical protein